MGYKTGLVIFIFGYVICGFSQMSSAQVTPSLTLDDSLELYHESGGSAIHDFGVVHAITSGSIDIVCNSDVNTISTIKWIFINNGNVLLDGDVNNVGNTLRLSDIRAHDEGTYMCEATDINGDTGTRQFTLDVLYKPTRPKIEGPQYTLKGVPATFTCTADSNPPSYIYWTLVDDPEATIEATGSTFELNQHLPEKDVKVYCWAEVTLVPSRGTRVPTRESNMAVVTVQEEAHIIELPSEEYFEVGTTILIQCIVGGVPSPNVWWERKDDEEFFQSGSTLLLYDAKVSDSGVYVCQVENTIVLPDSTKTEFYKAKEVIVHVTEGTTDADCQVHIASGVCDACCGMNLGSGSGHTDKECESVTGLIAAAGIGWLLTLMMTMSAMVLFLQYRALKRQGSKRQEDKRSETSEDSSTRYVSSNRNLSTVNLVPSSGRSQIPTHNAPYNVMTTGEPSQHEYLDLGGSSKSGGPDVIYSYAREGGLEFEDNASNKDDPHYDWPDTDTTQTQTFNKFQ